MRMCFALAMLTISFAASGQDQLVSPRLLDAREIRTSVGQASLQRQFDALNSMELSFLEYSTRGPVSRLTGNTRITLPASVRLLKRGDDATHVLGLLKDVLLAQGTEVGKVRALEVLGDTRTMVEMTQVNRGVPVYGAQVSVVYDPNTLRVSSISAHFVPDRGLPRAPRIAAPKAELLVPEAVNASGEFKGALVEIQGGTYLAYFAGWENPPPPPTLVWVVTANVGAIAYEFLVDALTGEIVYRRPLTSTALSIVEFCERVKRFELTL
jgi:hypothetical protein